MKKAFLAILLVFLAAALVMAGGSSEKKAEGAKLVKEFKLGYINSPIGPMHEAAVKYGELVREATGRSEERRVGKGSRTGWLRVP